MAGSPKETAITVSISVLSQLIRYLNHLNVDVDKMLRGIGIDPNILNTPDTRLSIETYLAVEDEAARMTGDPCFGLHMGEFAEPGSWTILGYMMMNCRDLREAFEKVGKYQRIIGNLITASARIGLGKVKFIYTVPKYAPVMSRHCFESAFSSSLRIIRNLTGKELSPLEVGFTSPEPPPEHLKEYGRIFRCPVLFAQKHNYMVMETSIGSTPVLAPNEKLLEHFEAYAREIITELEAEDDTTARVTRIILSSLDSKNFGIGTVAGEMSMSVRTLQNRLKEEGKVFSDLVREVREHLAKKCLREDYTVEDITYMLGFSDPAVFRKAFKKWSGATPKEYRDSTGESVPA
jgi:AraC-like DNA-binding protein